MLRIYSRKFINISIGLYWVQQLFKKQGFLCVHVFLICNKKNYGIKKINKQSAPLIEKLA